MHARAYLRYRRSLSADFDVIVDEVNTIPFFTPLWSPVPVVMFIHQLAREVWWYESPPPLNILGRAAEPRYLGLYRRTPVVTVSESTKSDLQSLGFRGPISVLDVGVERVEAVEPNRPQEASFLYVGRLTPSKRVTDIIRAFAQFSTSDTAGRLTLVGDGPHAYVRKLKAMAMQLGVRERIQFPGRLPSAVKHRAMADAHILLLASVREGWGLVVTEANRFGTPAIGYDVPGLRDSIQNRVTGILVKPSWRSLAQAMSEVWHDPSLYNALSTSAEASSQTFSFDITARQFRDAIAATAPHDVTTAVSSAK